MDCSYNETYGRLERESDKTNQRYDYKKEEVMAWEKMEGIRTANATEEER